VRNCKQHLRAIDWKEEKKGTRKGGEEKEDEKISTSGEGREGSEGRGRSTGRIASSRLQVLNKVEGT